MTTDERTELVLIIEEEIKTLPTKIDELKDFTQPVSHNNAIGRISRMYTINNKSIFDASMRNAQNRLMQLQNILSLNNDDSFGVCFKCHKAIPFERLKIRQEIRYCANCLKNSNEIKN